MELPVVYEGYTYMEHVNKNKYFKVESEITCTLKAD